MRKLIVHEFITLDGVIQAPGGPDEDRDGGFAHGGWTPGNVAGRARFTQYPTVFFPQEPAEYARLLESFLAADTIDVPAEFRRNARRFLYYQLFRTSLPFGQFLGIGVRSTHARLKWFDPRDLLKSAAIQTVSKGLFENSDFLLDEKSS